MRELFAPRDDSYAGVDVANAARIGGAIWWLGCALSVALLPFAPPDRLGGFGWLIAAGVILLAAFLGLRIRRLAGAVSVNELLAHTYLGLAVVAVLVWLTGGTDSPWRHIGLFTLMFTVAVHPPRRVAVYLGVFCAAWLGPLAYDWNQREALNMVTELVVWLTGTGLLMYLMTVVRSQRLGLRKEGERARRQARVDPLTGLQNRRAFDEALAHELERARASAEPLSVVVGDLDGFKSINDRFGHLEGDRILKAVSGAITQAIRGPDAAYRWGGDEFALILPGTPCEGARLVSDRIRSAVGHNATPDGEPIRLALGIGELGPEAYTAKSLLAEADGQLMDTKRRTPAYGNRRPG